MTTFEDTLWDRLAREHAADTVALEPLRGRSRRPLAISAGAAGIAAAAAAGVLLFGASASTPPAYALTTNPDGSVTVSINDIETAIPALNAEFQKDGIDETVIPVEADCTNPGIGSSPTPARLHRRPSRSSPDASISLPDTTACSPPSSSQTARSLWAKER
jgi:hypothetical protein